MRNFYTFLLISLFGLATTSVAQTVKGTITDNNTKETLIGVNILLDASGGTASDIDGNYILQASAGTHTLLFKFIGYKEVRKTITLSEGETLVLNIGMKDAAQELGTVVVSAGKFEQRIEETTVSMEVIKPSLIENKNTTNIQTAMEQVPGVNITDGQANIRGGSGWSYGAGTRVQVLVDDMPLISGDAGQAQWSLISTENINQVEVIKGASSALYGSSALNGVINIRTAYPGSEPETKINFHNGYYDNAKRESLNWWGDRKQRIYGADFLHKRKIGNLDLVLGGFLLEDEGYRLDEITSRKRFNFNTRYRDKKVDGLSYGVNGNFLFNETATALIWDSYESAYIALDSAVTKTSGDVYNIDPFITYVNSRNNDKHSLRTRYMKVINDNSTKGVDNGQSNQSQTFFSEYQYQKSIEGWRLNWTSGVMNELVQAEADLFQGKNYRVNNSIYTQVDKKFGKRLNLSAGARYERFTLQAGQAYKMPNGDTTRFFSTGKPVFRAGANYQVGEATFLRSSWGQGYRFPSIAEMFILTEVAGGIYVFPNPGLKPEEGWSSEIAIKQGVKLGNWKGFIDVAAFIMEYSDMMEFSFGQWAEVDGSNYGIGFKSINIGDTRITGFEGTIAGSGKVGSLTVDILGGYTHINPIPKHPEASYGQDINGTELNYYNSSSVDSTVLFLKYRHEHIAKLDIQVGHKENTHGLSMRYNSFMKNIDGIFASDGFSNIVPGINESREALNDGDFIMDYRYSRQVTDHSKVSLIINNLLNEEYQSRPANMMPPRTVSVQWSIKV
ncbi:MAG: TonB-dependent receptor [Bacteroidetes bacterium]|nr:TonB-dependent receptor [Bacteroidota bacterium]